MRDAIKRFFILLEQPHANFKEQANALALSLDTLAYEVHALPDPIPVESMIQSPDRESRSKRKHFFDLAVQAFPRLRLYAPGRPLAEIEDEQVPADAADDIADIAVALATGLWAWEHGGVEQGAARLRMDYADHWGLQLHNLRVFLHETLN